MARGIEAKQYVINKLKETFGADYLGENGGKYYVVAPDGETSVQMAITITCPAKEVIFPDPNATANRDGGAFSLNSPPPPATNSSTLGSGEMGEEEIERIKKLLDELGL